MRGQKSVVALTSGLLLAAAGLVLAGAWQRWAAACPIGGDWNSGACLPQQSHEHDVLLPSTTPWLGDHRAALLLGVGYVLLGCALLLLPAALAMKARPWQWAAVVLTVPSILAFGIATARSGQLGRVVDVDAPGLVLAVPTLALPVALFLLMWRPQEDSPPLGSRRTTAIWLLVLTTPLLDFLVVRPLLILIYSSYDTVPWSEAAIVPLLLAAAILLKPWSAARGLGHGSPAGGPWGGQSVVTAR